VSRLAKIVEQQQHDAAKKTAFTGFSVGVNTSRGFENVQENNPKPTTVAKTPKKEIVSEVSS
jgi:hypothetical protein